jgi:hypothetical protein
VVEKKWLSRGKKPQELHWEYAPSDEHDEHLKNLKNLKNTMATMATRTWAMDARAPLVQTIYSSPADHHHDSQGKAFSSIINFPLQQTPR